MLENHEELLENNEAIKTSLSVDEGRVRKDIDYSKRVGDEFMRHFFSDNHFNQFDKSELSENSPTDFEESVIADRIRDMEVSFLVIRPEMSHMLSEIQDFLVKNRYEVLEEISCRKIIPEGTYWRMYKNAITKPQARESMPTRTMVYTGGHSQLVFFKDSIEERERGKHMADVFFDRYKGVPGIPQENTLRGDIVYKEAKRLGFDNMERDDILQVVDPINSYRHFVKRGVGAHTQSKNLEPILFYTGVCVHVPNYSEISNDLTAIFSKDELAKILEDIKS